VRRAKAYAAAGSDARMSGSVMPVMTNSGSGNQGITVSLPLIVYAHENQLSEELLIRALVLSNLTAIHIKTNLGRLSAFCGVIPAGVGAACGITFLMGGTRRQIKYTVDNMLGNISGMFCDGAKPSCASKIASSVDAAFQASFLAMENKVIEHDTGIVGDDAEMTIGNIGKIASEAMNEIDQMIVKIMTNHERGC
jgi:L-cysteine desulfidase